MIVRTEVLANSSTITMGVLAAAAATAATAAATAKSIASAQMMRIVNTQLAKMETLDAHTLVTKMAVP